LRVYLDIVITIIVIIFIMVLHTIVGYMQANLIHKVYLFGTPAKLSFVYDLLLGCILIILIVSLLLRLGKVI
jgi:hypothetical protein